MWAAQAPTTQRLLKRVLQVAYGSAPVLIHGEPGTGKKLLATLIHELSNASAPLIYFSPASLPGEFVDTDLFGQESAGNIQRGRVELAQGGTLVLDEIATLTEPAQERLLHVINESSFRRPGGTRNVMANVRIIALSGLDPENAQRNAAVRGDLLSQFSPATLAVPSLRQRSADIPELATRFLTSFCALQRIAPKTLSPATIEALQAYDFPGNLSELRHVVELAATRAYSSEVTADVLPRYVTENSEQAHGARSLEDVEREHIAKILEFTKGRKTEAADILGISRKTLLEKRKRYGLG